MESGGPTASKATMTDPPKQQPKEECSPLELESPPYSMSQYTSISPTYITSSYNNSTFTTGNIGYYVYEYREEEEDTGIYSLIL